MNSTEKFLTSIDWALLGKQKDGLLAVIQARREHRVDSHGNTYEWDDPLNEDLTGILHLIDGLQDFFDAYLPEEVR